MMEIIGKLECISEIKIVSDKFRKRDFVLTTEEKYPQSILIELTQDKCDLIDKYSLGELLKAHININGRKWKSSTGEIKYFNTIVAWRLESLGTGFTPNSEVKAEEEFNTMPDNGNSTEGFNDHLPF